MTGSDDNAWVQANISANAREGHPGVFIRPGLIFIVMGASGGDSRDDVVSLIRLDIWSCVVNLSGLGDIPDHPDRVLDLENEHFRKNIHDLQILNSLL